MNIQTILTMIGVVLAFITALAGGFIAYGRLSRGQDSLKEEVVSTKVDTKAIFDMLREFSDAVGKSLGILTTANEVAVQRHNSFSELMLQRHTSLEARIDDALGAARANGQKSHHLEMGLTKLEAEVKVLRYAVQQLQQQHRDSRRHAGQVVDNVSGED